MLRMCSMIFEEEYECIATTIHDDNNADTIVKKK